MSLSQRYVEFVTGHSTLVIAVVLVATLLASAVSTAGGFGVLMLALVPRLAVR